MNVKNNLSLLEVDYFFLQMSSHKSSNVYKKAEYLTKEDDLKL